MVLLSYAAIYLIWGSTFLAIRLAIASIPPLLMMGVRCTAAGLLLLAAAALGGHRATPRAWGHAVIGGGLMFGVGYGALAWAELTLASGVTALLVATLPFWMTLIDWRQRGARPSRRTLVGLALGLSGVALLMSRGLTGSLALAPAAAVVIGELAWSAGALYSRPRLPAPLTLNAGLPLTTGGLWLIVAAWIGREFRGFEPRSVSAISLVALAYLIVFGSIVAFSAYQWLLRVAPASRVGTHAYVNPLIAVALGVGGRRRAVDGGDRSRRSRHRGRRRDRPVGARPVRWPRSASRIASSAGTNPPASPAARDRVRPGLT